MNNYLEITRKHTHVLFRSSADLEQEEAGQVTGIGEFFLLEKHNLCFINSIKVINNMFNINK